MDFEELDAIKEKLLDYGELEGCELGEATVGLVNFHNVVSYLGDDKFKKLVEEKLVALLKRYEDEFTIKVEEIQRAPILSRRLVHYSEE